MRVFSIEMAYIKQECVFNRKCVSPSCRVLVQQSFRISVLSAWCLASQPISVCFSQHCYSPRQVQSDPQEDILAHMLSAF